MEFMMIAITVNGKKETIKGPLSIHAFMVARALDPATVVVEYNREILSADTLQTITLKENDRLELLRFVGGG
jgi:sulfur carrier protein